MTIIIYDYQISNKFTYQQYYQQATVVMATLLLRHHFVTAKPLHICTQAQKRTGGDPSGVYWNYRGITLLYKFTTPCYIWCYQTQLLKL